MARGTPTSSSKTVVIDRGNLPSHKRHRTAECTSEIQQSFCNGSSPLSPGCGHPPQVHEALHSSSVSKRTPKRMRSAAPSPQTLPANQRSITHFFQPQSSAKAKLSFGGSADSAHTASLRGLDAGYTEPKRPSPLHARSKRRKVGPQRQHQSTAAARHPAQGVQHSPVPQRQASSLTGDTAVTDIDDTAYFIQRTRALTNSPRTTLTSTSPPQLPPSSTETRPRQLVCPATRLPHQHLVGAPRSGKLAAASRRVAAADAARTAEVDSANCLDSTHVSELLSQDASYLPAREEVSAAAHNVVEASEEHTEAQTPHQQGIALSEQGESCNASQPQHIVAHPPDTAAVPGELDDQHKSMSRGQTGEQLSSTAAVQYHPSAGSNSALEHALTHTLQLADPHAPLGECTALPPEPACQQALDATGEELMLGRSILDVVKRMRGLAGISLAPTAVACYERILLDLVRALDLAEVGVVRALDVAEARRDQTLAKLTDRVAQPDSLVAGDVAPVRPSTAAAAASCPSACELRCLPICHGAVTVDDVAVGLGTPEMAEDMPGRMAAADDVVAGAEVAAAVLEGSACACGVEHRAGSGTHADAEHSAMASLKAAPQPTAAAQKPVEAVKAARKPARHCRRSARLAVVVPVEDPLTKYLKAEYDRALQGRNADVKDAAARVPAACRPRTVSPESREAVLACAQALVTSGVGSQLEPNVLLDGPLDVSPTFQYSHVSRWQGRRLEADSNHPALQYAASQCSTLGRVLVGSVTTPLLVSHCNGKGRGVYSLKDVSAGSFVATYPGDILTRAAADAHEEAQLRDHGAHAYLWDLEQTRVPVAAVTTPEERACCREISLSVMLGFPRCTVAATHFGNVCRWLNHSCHPNLRAMEVDVPFGPTTVVFFALRDVPAGAELTVDYHPSMTSEELQNQKNAKRCLCGENVCKQWIT